MILSMGLYRKNPTHTKYRFNYRGTSWSYTYIRRYNSSDSYCLFRKRKKYWDNSNSKFHSYTHCNTNIHTHCNKYSTTYQHSCSYCYLSPKYNSCSYFYTNFIPYSNSNIYCNTNTNTDYSSISNSNTNPNSWNKLL